MDATQMAQMAQMEAAYAQMAMQQAAGYPHGISLPTSGPPVSGPYGCGGMAGMAGSVAPHVAASGPVKQPKPPKAYNANEDWGVPGFDEALTECVLPMTTAEMAMSPAEMSSVDEVKTKVGVKVLKACKKFATDSRLQESGTTLMAKALVEEFVEKCASAVTQAFYDKPWLEKVNLAAPLLAAALNTFNGSKIFTRTLAPMLPKYIEEGLFKYAEEERINKAMWEAVVASGVKESHQKKACNHLANAYDSAHIKSPYGSTTADSAELGMLQDFVKGWMLEFCIAGSRDVLLHGVNSGGPGAPTRGDQILFLTILFQNLTDARNAALPHELTSLIATPPPSPWTFIAETSETVLTDAEMAVKKAQALANTQAKGKGKGGFDPAMMMNVFAAMWDSMDGSW